MNVAVNASYRFGCFTSVSVSILFFFVDRLKLSRKHHQTTNNTLDLHHMSFLQIKL